MIAGFYRQPLNLFLVIAVLVVGGIAGFTTRPLQEDPDSEVRWGYVTTFIPGAQPQEVESQVSEPLETAIKEVGKVRFVESISMHGVSTVFVRLEDEARNVDLVWGKIQQKLSEAEGVLPSRAGKPRLVERKRWGAFTAVFAIVQKDPAVPPAPATFARWGKQLENQLRFVSGTQYTELFGLPEEEIRVAVGEQDLAETGLTLAEIAKAISERDSPAPDPEVHSHRSTIPVHLQGDLRQLADLRELVLAGDSERQLRLDDIAEVAKRERTPLQTAAYLDNRRAVFVATRMTPGQQISAWTNRLEASAFAFSSGLPEELELRPLFNQERYIVERAGRLEAALLLGMLLVALVAGLMMGWRAAIPIGVAIPLSVLTVGCCMIPFGIALHQMSLSGLILALGILIDNPIIVVDRVQQNIDAGLDRVSASQAAVKQLLRPLFGSNLTTILGFSPILLIPGPTGEFLWQLGWSVIASLVASLLLALTIIPVIAGFVLRARLSTASARPAARVHKLFRYPTTVIFCSLLLPAAGFSLLFDLREQFFPAAERDHFQITIRLNHSAATEQTVDVAEAVRQLLAAHDEVREVAFFVGANAPAIHYSMLSNDGASPFYAQAIVQLHSAQVESQFVNELQKELDREIPGAQCIASRFEQGSPVFAPIEFRIYGPRLEQLEELGQESRRLFMELPGVIHTRVSMDQGGAQLVIHARQHDSAEVGLTDDAIAAQVRQQLNGLSLTKFKEDHEELPINVIISNARASQPHRVFSLPIQGGGGQMVSLESVADWTIEGRAGSIHRRNGERCNVVYAYVAAGELPVEIEKQFEQRLQTSGFYLPPGYRFDFGGVSQERNSALGNLLAYAIAIDCAMIAILIWTMRSIRQAGIILLVAISSLGLGLLSLWCFNYPLGIVSIIGMMGMMGLAINDSIVVLSECNATDSPEQIRASVVASARHVFTTSATTIAGVLPLIFSGGEFWPPMMTVIAGGVAGATLLALGLCPAAYMLSRRRELAAPSQPATPVDGVINNS